MKLEQNWLDDISFFEQNRLKAHSDHSVYASKEDWKNGKEEYLESLNGTWRFAYACCLDEIEEKRKTAKDEIIVPGHIQMQGYDRIQYMSSGYTWDGWEDVENGKTPLEENPVGIYQREFEVPERFEGHPVGIRFHGVESAFAVWVNDQFAGYAEDSFSPSEFEITPYLKKGKNRLEVQVAKWCAGSWAEDQDFLRFSGIFRDVELFMVPENHLWDLEVGVKLSEDMQSAALHIRAVLHDTRQGMLHICCEELGLEKTVPLAGLPREQVEALFQVDHPLLWSAEDPRRYLLEFRVEAEDNTVEYIPQWTGFRRFELKDGLMLLNGKRIVFRGVNRHEFSAEKGRAIGKEEMLADILTLKRNNINAVRTSHYPNQSYWYELCDKYGIYLIDEANIETHGTWLSMKVGVRKPDDPYLIPNDKPEWLDILKDRAKSMLERDKNHPSVLMWSCGNEAYGGKVLYEISEYFRKRDGGRLVHYEGITKDARYPDTSDMASLMYPTVAMIEEHLKTHPDKPVLCCEYSHSMGNSNGGLFKYTELAETDLRYQGGFIWDFIDQAVWRRTSDNRRFLAYGGDYGDRPDNGAFSGNGLLFADRTPTPKLAEVKYCYQSFAVAVDREKAVITNRSLFTPLSSYDCFVCVEKEGSAVLQQRLDAEVLPGEKREIPLSLDFQEQPGYYYTIRVKICLKEDTLWEKKGYELAFGQSQPWMTEKKAAVLTGNALKVIDGNSTIGIRGNNFHILFGRGEGGIIAFDYKGKRLLDRAAVPNFWRAPVENDYGNGMPGRLGVWKLASKYRYVVGVELIQEKDRVKVSYEMTMPAIGDPGIRVVYTVTENGAVDVEMRYAGSEKLPELPEFGMLFSLDKAFHRIAWYGRGPWENYEDRKSGCAFGKYLSSAEQEMTPYLRPQECGNHTDTCYLEVRDEENSGLRFEGDGFSFSVLPFTPDQIEEAQHAYELPESRRTVLRISSRQMGVGGDDTWGAPVLEEFKLPAGEERVLRYRFYPIGD